MRTNVLKSICLVALLVILSACTKAVPPGTVGRINTPDGWAKDILKPGAHTCYGRDTMYLLDVTNKAFKEKMNVLIGGKVNLTIDIVTRVRANTEDADMMRKAFESVTATKADDGFKVGVEQMYVTFMQMKALAIPRMVFEIQKDAETAIANSPALAAEVRRQITELSRTTPLIVEDVQITNYDWPDSITKAQEELVKIQLREAASAAQVRADLKQAEGTACSRRG
jgi:hypothetical protein